MHRRTRILAAAGLALAPVMCAPGAFADDDRLGISADGVSFSDSINAPLFDPRIRWIPGNSEITTFYVRNQSDDAGDVAVKVTRADQRDPLFASDALLIDARPAGGAWTPIVAGDTPAVIDLTRVRAGDVVSLDVRARMRNSAPNTAMRLDADASFVVRLTDASAVLDVNEGIGDGGPGDGGLGDGGPGDGGGGGLQDGFVGTPDGTGDRDDDLSDDADAGGFLPGTGSDIPLGLSWLGLALTGAGAFLITRRRQDRAEVRRG